LHGFCSCVGSVDLNKTKVNYNKFCEQQLVVYDSLFLVTVLALLRYGDGVRNAVEENFSIFSLIRM